MFTQLYDWFTTEVSVSGTRFEFLAEIVLWLILLRLGGTVLCTVSEWSLRLFFRSYLWFKFRDSNFQETRPILCGGWFRIHVYSVNLKVGSSLVSSASRVVSSNSLDVREICNGLTMLIVEGDSHATRGAFSISIEYAKPEAPLRTDKASGELVAEFREISVDMLLDHERIKYL